MPYPRPWQPSLLDTSLCSSPSSRSLSSAVKESGSSTFCKEGEREGEREETKREGGSENGEFENRSTSFAPITEEVCKEA